MEMRPAVFAVLLIVAAVAAPAAKPASATAVARNSSSLASGHKALPSKAGRIIDLDWKELLPENERVTPAA